MPGIARKHQLAGCLLYHVYNRSNAKSTIFKDPPDKMFFKTLLVSYLGRFSAHVYHWAIMPNHYHLLLEIDDPENMSAMMAGLHLAYTKYYHRKYQSAGYLWQGRFKMQPIQKEDYLLACGRYIERNPVRKGLVHSAQEYEFSSAGFYCFGANDGVTETDCYFENFGCDEKQRREEYIQFLGGFDFRVDQNLLSGEPLGSEEFKRKLVCKQGRFFPRGRGRPGKLFDKKLC